MKKLAKILVLVLSVALVFGAIAMAVSAESEVCKIGEASYTSFETALSGAVSGDTITLSADVSVSASIVLDGVNLDLNGYKITGAGADALFVTNGNVSITNGTVESASELLFNVASGELTVNGVNGHSSLGNTNYLGVNAEELPDCFTVAEGANLITEDSEIELKPLYQINHADSTTTYFGTAEEFTQLWDYAVSETNGYYVIKSGDTIVMNGDITFTADKANRYTSTATGISFTLDVNGYTLDTQGYELLVADNNMGGRDSAFTFTLTSSCVGGVINSYKYNAGGGGAAEGVIGSPLINTMCGKKIININGAVNGVDTLTVNAAALYYGTGYYSNSQGTSYVFIDGGIYNMVGMAPSGKYIPDVSVIPGFITLKSSTDPSVTSMKPNGSVVTIDNATLVQAYHSPQSPNSLHPQLSYWDASASVNYYTPYLFFFDITDGEKPHALIESSVSRTQIICNNSTIIGRSPTSQVMGSRLITGQVNYNGCYVSADIAPANLKTQNAALDYSGRGRVVLDAATVFSGSTKPIVEYDATTVQGGVFAPAGMIVINDPDADSIPLPSVPSATEREGAIAISRPWVINGTAAGMASANYGTYNPNAGYYYIIPNGTDTESFITDDDIAASYTYGDAVESTVLHADRLTCLTIKLGAQSYYLAPANEFNYSLFYIKHANNSIAIYDTLDDWEKIITSHVTDPTPANIGTDPQKFDSDGDDTTYDGTLNSVLVTGDTIILTNDIVYTGDIEGVLGQLSVTIDLNGHKIDTTASRKSFLVVGGSGKGKGSGNHDSTINLTIKSSAPGGEIETRSGDYLLIDSCGRLKTVTIEGENLTIKTSRLIRHQIAGSSGDGRDCTYTFNGGTYYHKGDTQYTMFEVNSKYSRANVIVNDANIISDTDSWLIRHWAGKETADTKDSSYAGTLTFNNSSIVFNTDNAQLAKLQLVETSVIFNNTSISGSGLGEVKGGKMVFGEGCVINGFDVSAMDYDASKLADLSPESTGIYFGADGLHSVKTVGETKYTVTSAAAKQVSWTIGENVTSAWYLADADVTADFPVTNLYNNDIVAQSLEWNEASANNYVGTVSSVYTPYELGISTYLHTNLSINIYLTEAYAKACQNLEFVATEEEGIWVATVAINGNEAFTAIADALNFATEDGFTVTMNLNNGISLYNYISSVIGDESMTAAERDLMWYMVDYLKNAYKVMGLSNAEIAALGAEDEAGAKAIAEENLNALLAGYESSVSYEASSDVYAGEALGLDIAVDLTSAPRFVFTLDGAANVSVNGKALEVVDGVAYYEVENVHSFADVLTVATDLGSGEFSLANYYAAALAADSEELYVAETVEALYKYILAANAYKATLN